MPVNCVVKCQNPRGPAERVRVDGDFPGAARKNPLKSAVERAGCGPKLLAHVLLFHRAEYQSTDEGRV